VAHRQDLVVHDHIRGGPDPRHRHPGDAAAGDGTGPGTPPTVTGALVAGLFAGYGIAMPPGAVATYLVTLTAHLCSGRRCRCARGSHRDGVYTAIGGG